jgi:glucosamine kinase
MKYVIGVDGGATKTRAVLVSEKGQLLGSSTSGPSNYDDVGISVARENIKLVLQKVSEKTPVPPSRVDALFLGIAGIVSNKDRNTIEEIIQGLKLFPNASVNIDHDLRIAHAGGFAGEPGIVIIAGTGSSCYGRNKAGHEWRVGGWGHLLDDIGSSYFLGLQAIIATIRSADKRNPETLLKGAVLNSLRLNETQDIMRRVYHDGLSPVEIASMAPLVTDAAKRGDEVSLQIIQKGTKELAFMVKITAQILGFGTLETKIAFIGGLVQKSAIYKKALTMAIKSEIPEAIFIEPTFPPVLGAALLALEIIGIQQKPELVRALQEGAQRII